MKKGQGLEMMGLMVIVILLIVIATIYIKFASAPKTNIVQESLTNLQNSMLTAAISKTTICKDTAVEDAVKACSKDAKACGADACSLLEESLPMMLEATISKELEAERVLFKVEFGDEEKNINIGVLDCTGRTTIFAEPHLIFIFPGTASLKIGRCS